MYTKGIEFKRRGFEEEHNSYSRFDILLNKIGEEELLDKYWIFSSFYPIDMSLEKFEHLKNDQRISQSVLDEIFLLANVCNIDIKEYMTFGHGEDDGEYTTTHDLRVLIVYKKDGKYYKNWIIKYGDGFQLLNSNELHMCPVVKKEIPTKYDRVRCNSVSGVIDVKDNPSQIIVGNEYYTTLSTYHYTEDNGILVRVGNIYQKNDNGDYVFIGQSPFRNFEFLDITFKYLYSEFIQIKVGERYRRVQVGENWMLYTHIVFGDVKDSLSDSKLVVESNTVLTCTEETMPVKYSKITSI